MNIKTMDFPAGTSIEQCAKALVLEAQSLLPQQVTVEFRFNDFLLSATSESSADELVESWHKFSRESSEAFKASPEGRQLEAERQAYQQKLLEVAEPGLTIYSYELDNEDGRWKQLGTQKWQCFELWDGISRIDACIGRIPEDWPIEAKMSGKDSPERRFT